jgi:hypothetical protein
MDVCVLHLSVFLCCLFWVRPAEPRGPLGSKVGHLGAMCSQPINGRVIKPWRRPPPPPHSSSRDSRASSTASSARASRTLISDRPATAPPAAPTAGALAAPTAASVRERAALTTTRRASVGSSWGPWRAMTLDAVWAATWPTWGGGECLVEVAFQVRFGVFLRSKDTSLSITQQRLTRPTESTPLTCATSMPCSRPYSRPAA